MVVEVLEKSLVLRVEVGWVEVSKKFNLDQCRSRYLFRVCTSTSRGPAWGGRCGRQRKKGN